MGRIVGHAPDENETQVARRLRPEMASFRLLVLAFVRDYWQRLGASPSYGEIGAHFECSRNHARNAVRSLARDGLVVKRKGPRGILLPSLREEAIRQLEEQGFRVDPGSRTIHPPGHPPGGVITNPPLLPPPELTYPRRDGETRKGKDRKRAR